MQLDFKAFEIKSHERTPQILKSSSFILLKNTRVSQGSSAVRLMLLNVVSVSRLPLVGQQRALVLLHELEKLLQPLRQGCRVACGHLASRVPSKSFVHIHKSFMIHLLCHLASHSSLFLLSYATSSVLVLHTHSSCRTLHTILYDYICFLAYVCCVILRSIYDIISHRKYYVFIKHTDLGLVHLAWHLNEEAEKMLACHHLIPI